MDKLSPADKYDNLYLAGLARAKADWYFGMNTSRLYSVKDDCNHRLGRVKIPVLVMVTKRDSDIKNFVKRLYYKVFYRVTA
jgi:DNA topoisomerase-3